MSEKMKPCPFCGGANQEEYTRQEHASPTQHYIRCVDCRAMALGDTWNARDSEAKACAIKAWNTRSEQAEQDKGKK